MSIDDLEFQISCVKTNYLQLLYFSDFSNICNAQETLYFFGYYLNILN